MIKTIPMYTLKAKVNFMVRDLLCVHHPTQDARDSLEGGPRLFEGPGGAIQPEWRANAAIQLGTPWVRFSPFREAGSKEAGAAGYRLQEVPLGNESYPDRKADR